MEKCAVQEYPEACKSEAGLQRIIRLDLEAQKCRSIVTSYISKGGELNRENLEKIFAVAGKGLRLLI